MFFKEIKSKLINGQLLFVGVDVVVDGVVVDVDGVDVDGVVVDVDVDGVVVVTVSVLIGGDINPVWTHLVISFFASTIFIFVELFNVI